MSKRKPIHWTEPKYFVKLNPPLAERDSSGNPNWYRAGGYRFGRQKFVIQEYESYWYWRYWPSDPREPCNGPYGSGAAALIDALRRCTLPIFTQLLE